jgi:hypothetical protein
MHAYDRNVVILILYLSHTDVQALELRSTDKNCLIARAQCYLQLGEADKALADANETLKQDANYIKVLQYASMTIISYFIMLYCWALGGQ